MFGIVRRLFGREAGKDDPDDGEGRSGEGDLSEEDVHERARSIALALLAKREKDESDA